MNTRLAAIVAAGTLGLFATVAFADNPMVGGAAMYPNKDIVDNAVNSKDHTTLVAAVKAAGLVDTLKGQRSLYRIRTHKRSVRKASSRNRRDAPEAREQGKARDHPEMSRRFSGRDVFGDRKNDRGRQGCTSRQDGRVAAC